MRFFRLAFAFTVVAFPLSAHEYDCSGMDPRQNKVHFYIDRQPDGNDRSAYGDVAQYQRVGTLEATRNASGAEPRVLQVERMFAENYTTIWRSLGGLSLAIDNDNDRKPEDQKIFNLVTPALNGAEPFRVKCSTPKPPPVLNRAVAALVSGQSRLLVTVAGSHSRSLLYQFLLNGGSTSGESIYCSEDGSFCGFEIQEDGGLQPVKSIPQSDRNIEREGNVSGVQREPFSPGTPVRLDLIIRGDAATAIMDFTGNVTRGKSLICSAKTAVQEATCALRLDPSGKAYPYEIIK